MFVSRAALPLSSAWQSANSLTTPHEAQRSVEAFYEPGITVQPGARVATTHPLQDAALKFARDKVVHKRADIQKKNREFAKHL